jgi:hypothetical protein
MPNTLTEEQKEVLMNLLCADYIGGRDEIIEESPERIVSLILPYIEQLLTEAVAKARKEAIAPYEGLLGVISKQVLSHREVSLALVAVGNWGTMEHTLLKGRESRDMLKLGKKLMKLQKELQGVDSSVKEGGNEKN